MQKLKILIVENTPADSKLIRTLIENDKEAIAESFTLAESFDEALDVLATDINFDLSILDVKLDGHKSFELIESFPKHRFGLITFMTDEDIPTRINRLAQPVLQIEKPFDKAQIANFISEVKKLKKLDASQSTTAQAYLSQPKKFGILKARGENLIVNISAICSIEADDKCSIFYCFDQEKNKYYQVNSNESFGKVFERLPFLQCFKSWIVNPDYITKIIPDTRHGGTIYTEHPDSPRIPYSDNYKDAINQKINSHKL